MNVDVGMTPYRYVGSVIAKLPPIRSSHELRPFLLKFRLLPVVGGPATSSSAILSAIASSPVAAISPSGPMAMRSVS